MEEEEDNQNQEVELDLSQSIKGLIDHVLDADDDDSNQIPAAENVDDDDSNQIPAAENVDDDALKLPEDIEFDDEDWKIQEEEEPGFSHFTVFGDDNTEYTDYIQCPFPNCSALILDDRKGFLIRACATCWKIFCVKCQVRWHMHRRCEKNMLREEKRVAIRILVRPKSDQDYGSERFPVLESRRIQEVIDYELQQFSSYGDGESSNSQISSSEFSWDDPVLPVDFASSQIQPSSSNHSSQEHGESSNSQISSSEPNWAELLGFEPEYIQCPFPYCSALFEDDLQGFLIRACPKCFTIFCMKCRVRWHLGLKCREKNLAMMVLERNSRSGQARFNRNRIQRENGQERRELKKSPLGSKGSKRLWEFFKEEDS